jgi:hypothetical protein
MAARDTAFVRFPNSLPFDMTDLLIDEYLDAAA